MLTDARPTEAPNQGSGTPAAGRPTPAWLAPVAIGALGVIALSGLVFLSRQQSFEPTPPAPKPAQSTVSHPAAASGPKFDSVRVDAGGNAVIAGTATPGATVSISANGKTIGTVKADQAGSFAFVTGTPLAAGPQRIALSAALPSGTVAAGQRSVTVSVPQAPDEGALAVLTGGGKLASKVLTGQGPKPGTLGIGSVDYNGKGNAVIAGTAKPGADIMLFLGKSKVGTAVATPNGRWTMHTNHLRSQPGTFRLETIGKGGAVTATMQTAYAPSPVAPLAPGDVVIKQGQSLWLIARNRYGHGMDYSLIYRANEATIRDPNLIYPGQRFVVPTRTDPAPG